MKYFQNVIKWLVLIIIFHSVIIFAQHQEDILIRNDKHFLGGGKMVIWAPEYPRFLDVPGFWDHACFLNYKVEPIFTITFLDEQLNEIQLELSQKTWLPSHLTLHYQPTSQLTFQEDRALLPDDVLVSRFRIYNSTSEPRRLHIILWTSQNVQQNANPEFPKESKNANFIYSLFNSRARVSWERLYNNADAKLNMKIGMALGADQYAKTTAINVSSSTWNFPAWKLTPFFEKISKSGLPNEKNFDWRIHPEHYQGLLYIGLYYTLEVPPQEIGQFSAFCAIGPTEQKAIETFDRVRNYDDPIQTSIENWSDFFNTVPKFRCSDPYLEKYYYYRWYGLRLNMVNTNEQFKLPYPCIFEGINKGWFRHHISYSAQVHILETRWMHDPNVAMGSLLNFIYNQNPDGSFPGCIMMGFQEENVGFYHANWGRAVRELYRVHPNQEFLYQAYHSLKKYAQYFDRERDKEKMNLYDVINQWETGQEFNGRYLFVNPDADKGEKIQLKGVDASTYLYELQQNLAWMAKELGRTDDAEKWSSLAKKTRNAILEKMWDDSRHFFFDIDPKTGKKSLTKAAVGFYPFLTDLISPEHLSAITDHLLNPNEFWTDYPVPSVSLDDPTANIFGEWKGKRLNCPWNGRSWLMSTSHVCDALANTAQTIAPELKPKAVALINRVIHTLFLDNDLNKPSSFEYYNPISGKAPFFRGTDDYMHSWINDLIIKYVVGLQPQDGNKIVIDPLPFNLDSFTLDNIQIKGRLLKILWRKNDTPAIDKGLYLFVDEKLVKHWKRLGRYEITINQ